MAYRGFNKLLNYWLKAILIKQHSSIIQKLFKALIIFLQLSEYPHLYYWNGDNLIE